MKDQQQIDEMAILREFVTSTPIWYEQMKKYETRQCVWCGMVPENMLKLSKAIEHLAL